MEVRLDRVCRSIETFFEHEISGNFLGVPQAGKDHFDRFRSFLHSYYIEQHGFWPPAGFELDTTKWTVYSSMYSDFRNLYHHLVDADSPTEHSNLLTSGGVCALQNIRAFDARQRFDTLPRPLPRIPVEPVTTTRSQSLMRRRSWNPITQKKLERDSRNSLKVQSLINASNRDMSIMSSLLVRRFCEFEAQSTISSYDHISLGDGRKIRWILIYAILQTLISIMQAPLPVRNTEGLSYSLCCKVPESMPWRSRFSYTKQKKTSEIVPDIDYIHPNTSSNNVDGRQPRSLTKQEKQQRRKSLPGGTSSFLGRSSSNPRSSSLRRFMSLNRKTSDEPTSPKQAAFCEILVHGYGNGLNEVTRDAEITALPDIDDAMRQKAAEFKEAARKQEHVANKPESEPEPEPEKKVAQNLDIGDLLAPNSTSVSRESSNASSNTTWSKSSRDSEEDVPTPNDTPKMTNLIDMLKASAIDPSRRKLPSNDVHVYDEVDGVRGSVHINTKTWDEILGISGA